MKKLAAPRNTTTRRLHHEVRLHVMQETMDRAALTGCTGGEFSLDCPFCFAPDPHNLPATL